MKTFNHKMDKEVMMRGFQIEGNPTEYSDQAKELIGYKDELFDVYISERLICDDKFDKNHIEDCEKEYKLHVDRMKCIVKEGDWIITDWYGVAMVMTTEQIYREFEETDREYIKYFDR